MFPRILSAILAAAFFATAHAQDPKPAAAKPGAEKPAAEEPHMKVIQEVFNCLAGGLPADWKIAWVNVLEVGRSDDGKSRNFEANVRYTSKEGDNEGEPLKPCDMQKVIQHVGELNDFLKPEERAWTAAQLVFLADGKFEVKYDYTPRSAAPAAETPAAKPGAKPAARAKPAPKPGAGFKLKSQ